MNQDNFFKITSIVLSVLLIGALTYIFVFESRAFLSNESNGVISNQDSSRGDQTLTLGAAADLVVDAKADCAKRGIKEDNEVALDSCTQEYYIQKAMADQDASVCSVMTTDSARVNCLDSYYYSKALSTSPDPAYCQKLSDATRREPCSNEANYYLAKLNTAKAGEYCGKITTESLEQLCLEKFAK